MNKLHILMQSSTLYTSLLEFNHLQIHIVNKETTYHDRIAKMHIVLLLHRLLCRYKQKNRNTWHKNKPSHTKVNKIEWEYIYKFITYTEGNRAGTNLDISWLEVDEQVITNQKPNCDSHSKPEKPHYSAHYTHHYSSSRSLVFSTTILSKT